MNRKCTVLTLFCLALAVIPASAQVLYSNGTPNLNAIAWTINFGYTVSDTFTLPGNSTITGFDMWVWEAPGDKALTVDWSITSAEFGGTTYSSGTASVTDTILTTNQYGYQIDQLTGGTGGVALARATYWLNMQNAVMQSGGALYWDENSGASQASENTIGSIPSETFDITGYCADGDCGPPTPEPGSIMLFGSGILGIAGVLRRKRL
jgi:hypothetical protein